MFLALKSFRCNYLHNLHYYTILYDFVKEHVTACSAISTQPVAITYMNINAICYTFQLLLIRRLYMS